MPKPPEQTDHSTMDEEEEEGDEEEEEEDSPLKLRKFLEESGKLISVFLFEKLTLINSSCGGGHYRGGGPGVALSARRRLGLGGVRR